MPLALALLAPILVGISAFHVLLAPSGLLVPLALVALEVVLAWGYRDAFAPMLHVRTAARPITTPKAAAGVPVTAGVAS